VTSRDLALLLPALDRATGRPWTTCVCGDGRLLAWPAGDGGRIGGQLALVECWTQDAYRSMPHTIRRVALRSQFRALDGDRRDIEAGPGWPARAAAAVVEMLERRA
jgi:hypothetical protein